jgi:iron complex outermembrane recepter protein
VHWKASDIFALRGTYGTSFKAPFLKDIHQTSFAFTAPVPAFLDPGATGPITNTLIVSGGNPNLKPEKATSWTAGFDLKLPFLAETKIGATYFDTQYRDRIAFPAPNALYIFDQPQLYPGALIRNPSQAQVDAAISSVTKLESPTPPPGSINAIVIDPLENVAAVHISGVDLSTSTQVHTGYGDLSSSLDFAYLARFDQRSTGASPVIHQLNTIGNPVKDRARVGVSWADRGFVLAGFVNYIGRYASAVVGSASIASWTTTDFQLSFNSARGGLGSALGDTNFSLSFVNAFDRDPPFANGSTGYGYDDANANLYGRLVAFDVRHRW